MAEERVVFDFTDEEVRKETDDWNSEYSKHIRQGRKRYSVIEEENIATVSFITKNDIEYDCIYYKKTTKDIEKLIKNNEDINLQYCYIKDFDIRKIENYRDYELINFDASLSFWEGNTNFFGAKFGEGNVSFRRTEFGEGDVSFSGVQFGEGNVSFWRTDFGEGDVSFDMAQFGEGNVSFWSTEFGEGDVSFDEVQFGEGDVSFDMAQFGEGNVSFEGAQFGEGDVSFWITDFGEGDVSFENAKFGEGNVSFWSTDFGEGDVSFYRVQFGEGDVNFYKAQFGEGDVNFQGAKADRVLFDGQKFLSYDDLRFDSINRLAIEDCILEKTLKVSGIHKKSSLSLKDTVNIGQICFEDNSSKHVVGALKRNIKQNFKKSVEELFTRDKKVGNGEDEDKGFKRIINLIKKWLADKEKYKKSITMVKENYHNLGDYEGEDRAYRLYMKYKTNTFFGWPLKFFNLVGGYGTKPLRIVIAMLVSWSGFAGVYCTVLKDQFDKAKAIISNIWDALYYSGITFLTIGYGDISPAIDGTALRFVSIVEGFIGLFLMSYLTVAVVRKLLR